MRGRPRELHVVRETTSRRDSERERNSMRKRERERASERDSEWQGGRVRETMIEKHQ